MGHSPSDQAHCHWNQLSDTVSDFHHRQLQGRLSCFQPTLKPCVSILRSIFRETMTTTKKVASKMVFGSKQLVNGLDSCQRAASTPAAVWKNKVFVRS